VWKKNTFSFLANCLEPRAVVAYPEVLRQAFSASTKAGVMSASAEVSQLKDPGKCGFNTKKLGGLTLETLIIPIML